MAEDAGAVPQRLPNFIADVAAEADAFGAHARIAHAIVRLVRSSGSFKVVGLLGPWGSGKSTVVRLLEREVEADANGQRTYFFTYDAWMHQSDPPRRAFLEALIYFLIRKGVTKKSAWSSKLDELNQRTETTETTSTPTFTAAGRIIALSLLAVPLGLPFIGYEWFSASYGHNWIEHVFRIEPPFAAKIIFPLAIALTSAPLWVGALIYLSWRPRASMFSKRFWWTHRPPYTDESIISIFANREVSKNKTTISRGIDPTAIEFQIAFREIISKCLESDARFVLVIDNLDRLPESDAIALWSTIRSFFLGGEELNGDGIQPTLPVIILPIDERAVVRMYASKQQDPHLASELAQSFMDKTFDLTFRVPPPVLSDWSGFFEQQLQKVFSDQITEEDIFNITGILRQLITSNPDVDVTPRFVNALINLIGTMWIQWGDQIPFASIGYFCIHRAAIEKTILVELGHPKGGIDTIDRNWQQSLAAMHFGVANLSDALQIVMEAPLLGAITENKPDDFQRLSMVKGFDWAFEQTLEQALANQSSLADPQFALFASALLETLSGARVTWLRQRRAQIRKTFTAASTWKSLDSADPTLVAAFLSQVPRTDARALAVSLSEKLSAIESNQLASHKSVQTFAGLVIELSNFCRTHQVAIPRVTVPGEATTYLQLLSLIGTEKSTLQALTTKATDIDVLAQLQKGLATQESANALVDQISAMAAAELTIDFGGLAETLIQAVVDKPPADFAVLPALEALGRLRARDKKIQPVVKARVDNGQFSSVFNNALVANLHELAARMLALIITSGSAVAVPPPPNGSWPDFMAKNTNFIPTLDAAIKRYAGDTTLHLVVNAARADQGLNPVAKAIFSKRIGAKELGALFLKDIVSKLPTYTAYVDGGLVREFYSALASYAPIWDYVSEIPISLPLNELLISLLESGETGSAATDAIVAKLTAMSASNWSAAISENSAAFALASALADRAPGHSASFSGLMPALEELDRIVAETGSAEVIQRWFKAAGWLSEASRAVLFKNLRDILLGGAFDSRAQPVLSAAPAEFIERGEFEEKSDDTIRHIVMPMLAGEEGRSWLQKHLQVVGGWIQRSVPDGPERQSLIERLSGSSDPGLEELRVAWDLPSLKSTQTDENDGSEETAD